MAQRWSHWRLQHRMSAHWWLGIYRLYQIWVDSKPWWCLPHRLWKAIFQFCGFYLFILCIFVHSLSCLSSIRRCVIQLIQRYSRRQRTFAWLFTHSFTLQAQWLKRLDQCGLSRWCKVQVLNWLLQIIFGCFWYSKALFDSLLMLKQLLDEIKHSGYPWCCQNALWYHTLL